MPAFICADAIPVAPLFSTFFQPSYRLVLLAEKFQRGLLAATQRPEAGAASVAACAPVRSYAQLSLSPVYSNSYRRVFQV
jgi:hypothetical protein